MESTIHHIPSKPQRRASPRARMASGFWPANTKAHLCTSVSGPHRVLQPGLGLVSEPPICQQTKSWAPAFGQERTTPSGLTENRSSVDSGSILAPSCPWQSCRPSFQGSLCPHSSARPGTPNPSAHPRPEGQAAAEPPRLHTLPQGCHAPLTGKSR